MELYEVALLFSTGALFIGFFLFTCYYVCVLIQELTTKLQTINYKLRVTSTDGKKGTLRQETNSTPKSLKSAGRLEFDKNVCAEV